MPHRKDSRHSDIEDGHMQSNERRVSNTRTCRSRDENLALFSDLRNQERNNFLHPSDGDDTDMSLSTEIRKFTSFSDFPSTTPPRRSTSLLASDHEKNDYDWLITPPATPLFTSPDKKLPPTHVQKSQWNQAKSTSSMAKLLKPGARKVPKGSQPTKRSRSSFLPSTDRRKNVIAKITVAKPTSHTAIDLSLARPRRASSFRSSSIEKYPSPSNSIKGVSLSTTSQASQNHQDGSQAEKPSNLCSTRAEWVRSHSKTTALRSRPGDTNEESGGLDTGEICKQPKSLSFGSRMPSSIASLDYLSLKEPVPDNLLVKLPISTQRDQKAECQRLAYSYSSTPKSCIPSTQSMEFECLSKDLIWQTPLQAPTSVQNGKGREMHYTTTNPLFKPSTNSIARSRQEEELSDDESTDELVGTKESEDKWKQTTFSKTPSKVDSGENQRHAKMYKDHFESPAKASLNRRSFQPMPTEAGSDELVHKKLAGEALVLLERISRNATKQSQVDILEPIQGSHLPTKTDDHEDEAVCPHLAFHEKSDQASHQKKNKKESPLHIKRQHSESTWSLFTNQARRHLRDVHARLSCFKR